MTQEQIIKLLQGLIDHLNLRAEIMESQASMVNSNELDMEYDRGVAEGIKYSSQELEDIIKLIRQ